jgi:chitodextrinase
VLGLTPATTYRFQVRAYDAANNFSTAAGPVPVSTPDTIPPSTPGTLSATTISTSRIDLSWGASTDNVGVALYAIQRCQGAGCVNFADYTTTGSTTFSDMGLPDTTTYNYRVRARDAAFVWSEFTNTAGAQTFDGTAPSTPTGLTVSPVAGVGTALNLSWTASTDNLAVTGYAVDRCQGASCINFVEIALPTTNSFADSGLSNGGTYNYRVRARDARANWSPNSAVATGIANDTQLPTAPSGLAVSVGSATQLNLTWTAATDNVGVTLYSIQRCQGASCNNFADVGTSTTTSFNSTGLAPATTYRFQVRARDATNWGPYSNQAAQTTPADGQAPTAPTGLTVGTRTVTQINLSWTASTDNIGVTQYVVQRCTGTSCTPSTDVGTSATTSYADNSLTPGTTYRYQVRARDAASNTSGASNVVSAATLADSSPPSTPTIVITGTTVTTVTMTLSATDNVGVTGYQLDRCTGASCTSWAQVATPSSSPYTDTGRAANTTYRYRARARDAAGGTSPNSSVVSAATLADNSFPTAPGNLRSPSKTADSVSLAWDAATDNVGIATYRIQRCTGAGCNSWAEVGSTTAATTTFTSNDLAQLTTYRFRVGARDGAGNTTYTSPMSVTTNDGQAPTAPGGLQLTVTPGQILLQWNASTDNVGVTAYLVERCNTTSCTYAQIASVGSTSYLDTTVASATNYNYRVAARDAQGNVSGWSTVGAAQSADCD